MALQQLRTFLEVHRQNSISEAARVLGLTQPAASQHIASLEVQIGKPLFTRHARGVSPTGIADDLAASLGNSLDLAEAALSAIRARSMQVSGTVHIAGPADYIAEGVAPCLAPLLAVGLSLRLHVGGKEALYEMLLEGQTDLAFTASRPEDARLAFQPIGKETLMAVAAPKIAERIRKGSDLAAMLERIPHLAYDLERPLIRNWLVASNLPILRSLPAITVTDLRVMRSLVISGAGWSVLPDYLCVEEIEKGSLAVIDTPGGPISNQLFLAWKKSALRHPRVALARNILLRALSQG